MKDASIPILILAFLQLTTRTRSDASCVTSTSILFPAGLVGVTCFIDDRASKSNGSSSTFPLFFFLGGGHGFCIGIGQISNSLRK